MTECSICYEEVAHIDQWPANCGHVFHSHCVLQWWQQSTNTTCPICRLCDGCRLEQRSCMENLLLWLIGFNSVHNFDAIELQKIVINMPGQWYYRSAIDLICAQPDGTQAIIDECLMSLLANDYIAFGDDGQLHYKP